MAKSRSSEISNDQPESSKLGLKQLKSNQSKLKKEGATIEITGAEAAFPSSKVDDEEGFLRHLISSGISKNAVTDARCSAPSKGERLSINSK